MGIRVLAEKCNGCKLCIESCLQGTIEVVEKIAVIGDNCNLCGACVEACPGGAILIEREVREEKIPEAYCSKCKDFRVQMKRMSLWRLPPVVIIHLKRFLFTQHMRRKLRDLVVFPIEGLDLSRIMAQESETAPPSPTQKSEENGEANSATVE